MHVQDDTMTHAGGPLSSQSSLKEAFEHSHTHTLRSDMRLLVLRPLACPPLLSILTTFQNKSSVVFPLSASTHSPPLIHTTLQMLHRCL